MYVDKSPLRLMKKMFDGTSFMLKAVDMEKVADKCCILALKGKRHDTRK